MSYICPICHGNCKPNSVNGIGFEIQEYKDKLGWLGNGGEIFSTRCETKIAIALIPEDGIKRRHYDKFE